MEKIFGRKLLSEKKDENSSRTPSGYQITQDDIKKVNLYNKGVNKMAEEKFEDAIRCFDLSLRIDPFFVDALIKKGYSHFHLKQKAAEHREKLILSEKIHPRKRPGSLSFAHCSSPFPLVKYPFAFLR